MSSEVQYLTRGTWLSWQKYIIKLLQAEGLACWIKEEEWPDMSKITNAFDTYRLKQHQQRTVAILKSHLSPEVEPVVEDLQDPAKIWTALKANFELTGRAPAAFTYLEYTNIKIGHDEDIPSFIARLDAAYRKLTDTGESISENQRIFKLLENLPAELDYLMREFDNLPVARYTYEQIKSDIITEVNRKEMRERQRHDIYAAGPSGYRRETPRTVPKATIKCRKCGRNGHKEHECRKSSGGTYIAELIDHNSYSSEVMPPSWDFTLDSASTAHICQNKDFFVSLKPPPPSMIVRMGTTPHAVRGIGSVEFTVKDKGRYRTVKLREALYVPSIHKNLISMSKMDRARYHAKMDNGFQIFDPNWKYLYTARLQKQFYVLHAIKPQPKKIQEYPKPKKIDKSKSEEQVKPKAAHPNQSSFVSKQSRNDKESKGRGASHHQKNMSSMKQEACTTDRNNLMLWHERLGHINVQYVQKMFKEQLVEPVSTLRGKAEKCEPCTLAKSSRQPHPKLHNIRSKGLLELVHADVWGPSPIASRNHHRYLLTCIDDFSRRAYCYPLKTKDEVIARMISFVTYAERQTGKKVKVIRTDNGLEFCNKTLEDYMNKNGIKHERTSISSPQMNGVAERYNRVLFEGVRTLKIAANLPDNLWTETVMTVNYLRNRVWHDTIQDIPFTRWYRKKPSLKHLRRYGCVAYVHQPKDRRTSKFQPRAKKGIFVGYGLGSAGYRVWIPQENVILESKHVTFDETKLGRSVKVDQVSRLLFLDNDDMSFQIPPDEEISQDDIPDHLPGTSMKLTEAEKAKAEEDMRETIPDVPIPIMSSSSELDSDDDDDRSHTGKAKFYRYQIVRRKGKSKGRKDTYVKAPTGEKLRSDRELKLYCKENNIEYDNIVANFKSENDFQGPIYLVKLNDEALCTEVIIPKSSKHALELPESKHWQAAMNSEIDTMLERKVWTAVPYSKSHKVIGNRWVFTVKRNADGEICNYKARLVVLGNMQREGLDYDQTFSPVINFTLIRVFVTLFSCILHWVNCLLDVKAAYLYGDIDKDIYMKQPDNYKIKGKESYVLKLNKAIYGLHQAGRCWHHDLREKLISNGFSEIEGVTCAFTYQSRAIILVYVDDLPIFAKDEETLNEIVNLINDIYEVKNLGEITQLLGVNFSKEEDKLFNINCASYIEKCLKKFNITNPHVTLPSTPGYQPEPVKSEDIAEDLPGIPYRSLLGSLQYMAHRCRPDISWVTAALSQFTERHGSIHYKELLRVLMYLGATKQMGTIMQESDTPLQLTCYADSSWNSTIPERKSWTGYILLINGVPVSWRCIKQKKVAASPMEAELVSAAEAVKEIKYIAMVINQILLTLCLNIPVQKPILFMDNTAAAAFVLKRTVNVSTRYIDLDLNFIRSYYEEGLFDIKHVNSKDNLADILTKSLPRDLFLRLRNFILQ